MLESPLSAAIDILATDNGVHRINVVDGNGRVRGILSQTDIIKFLLSKSHLFTDSMKATLESVKLGCGAVVSVNAESSVLDALERMSEYYISSVAVVEPDGTLIGNISMADIRFIFQHGRYHRLWMNCSQFVSLALNQKGLEHGGNDQFPFFDAHLSSSVEQVMNKILATHVHRVWITEPRTQRLIGVVSMTDLIRLFFERTFERIEQEDAERARDSYEPQSDDY
jgi:CBS domain-containing protein